VQEAVGDGAEGFELAMLHGACETPPSHCQFPTTLFRADEKHPLSAPERNVVQPLSTAGTVTSLTTLPLPTTSLEVILRQHPPSYHRQILRMTEDLIGCNKLHPRPQT
jgi:hypothetical protein